MTNTFAERTATRSSRWEGALALSLSLLYFIGGNTVAINGVADSIYGTAAHHIMVVGGDII